MNKTEATKAIFSPEQVAKLYHRLKEFSNKEIKIDDIKTCKVVDLVEPEVLSLDIKIEENLFELKYDYNVEMIVEASKLLVLDGRNFELDIRGIYGSLISTIFDKSVAQINGCIKENSFYVIWIQEGNDNYTCYKLRNHFERIPIFINTLDSVKICLDNNASIEIDTEVLKDIEKIFDPVSLLKLEESYRIFNDLIKTLNMNKDLIKEFVCEEFFITKSNTLINNLPIQKESSNDIIPPGKGFLKWLFK